MLDLSCVFEKYADPESNVIGLGVMDISTWSENHENEDIWAFWKTKVKSC